MDIGLKITGMCCLAIMFCVSLALGYDDPEIWGSILGLVSLVLGGGSEIKKAIKHILRIS